MHQGLQRWGLHVKLIVDSSIHNWCGMNQELRRARAWSLPGSLAGAALFALVVTASEPVEQPPVSVTAARDRAQVLHGVYVATLEVMHERYFHDEKAIVPARALEDVFAEMARQQ